MTPQRVTLITLGVANFGRAKAFYNALGLHEKERTPGIVFYHLNGMVLGLFGLQSFADDQGRPDAKPGTGAMTLAQNFNDRAEVDAVFQAALAEVATAPDQRGRGSGRRF